MSRSALRAWYEPRRRAYPWRGVRDPYRVLVSEVMLQQTQASRVVPAFRAFVRRFPTVRALARASRAEVLRAWGSLGYNRRAVALSEAARAIVREFGGRVPADPGVLAALPGIGPYTASAVSSLGHGLPVSAVDTNVRRVVARARLGRDDAPMANVRVAAASWLDRRDPGGWNQALMDLGRKVCRPVPRCGVCPLARSCAFRRDGAPLAPRRRRQPPFEGSFRQVRGTVVRALRARGWATLGALWREVDQPPARVTAAVRMLVTDGVVRAGPVALRGEPSGRVRLGT